MGAAISSDVNTAIEKASQSITNNLSQSCTVSSVNVLNDTSIILDNSQTGDIDLTQVSSIDSNSSCILTAAIDTMTQAVQSSIQQGTASPSLFLGVQINTSVNTTSEDISNQISNYLTSTCQATSSNTENNTLLYATNSKTGAINIVQSSDAGLNCVLNNTLKATANVNQESNQTANAGGTNWLTIIMYIIIAVLAIGAVVAIIKVISSNGNKPKDTDNTDASDNTTDTADNPASTPTSTTASVQSKIKTT